MLWLQLFLLDFLRLYFFNGSRKVGDVWYIFALSGTEVRFSYSECPNVPRLLMSSKTSFVNKILNYQNHRPVLSSSSVLVRRAVLWILLRVCSMAVSRRFVCDVLFVYFTQLAVREALRQIQYI